MGLGYALTEELVIREGRVLNPQFMEYALVPASDMPEIAVHLIETRGRGRPLRRQGPGRVGRDPGGGRRGQCGEGRDRCADHRRCRSRPSACSARSRPARRQSADPRRCGRPRSESRAAGRARAPDARAPAAGRCARPAPTPPMPRRLGGVEPHDIRTAADWARLPFLTKDELRDAYPFGLACCPPRATSVRVHMSSGTTGNPDRQSRTRAPTSSSGASVMARCYAAAGVTARDVIHITAVLRTVHGRVRLSLRSRAHRRHGDPGRGRPDVAPAAADADLGATVLAGHRDVSAADPRGGARGDGSTSARSGFAWRSWARRCGPTTCAR